MGVFSAVLAAMVCLQAPPDMEKYREFLAAPQITIGVSFQSGDLGRALAHERWLALDKKGSARTAVEDLAWLDDGMWPKDVSQEATVKAALAKPGVKGPLKLRIMLHDGLPTEAEALDASIPHTTSEQMAAHALYASCALSYAMGAHSIAGGASTSGNAKPEPLSKAIERARKVMEEVDGKAWAFAEPAFGQLRMTLVLAGQAQRGDGAYKLPIEAAGKRIDSDDRQTAAMCLETIVTAAIATDRDSAAVRPLVVKAIDRLAGICRELPPSMRVFAVRVLMPAAQTLEDPAKMQSLMRDALAGLPNDAPGRADVALACVMTGDPQKMETLIQEERKIADAPILRKAHVKLLFKARRSAAVEDLLEHMNTEEEKGWVDTAHKALALYRAQSSDEVQAILKDLSELANKEGEPEGLTADRVYLMVVGCAMTGQMDMARQGIESLRRMESDYPGLDALASAVGA